MAKAKMTGKEIVQLFSQIESERSTFDQTWQEISDHILGRRSFNTHYQPGFQRTVHIYDTTPMLAGDLLASSLNNITVDPASRWFSIVTQNRDLMEDGEVIDWIDRVERIMYDHFYRPGSRFVTQMHEVHRDLVYFNTACMLMQEDPKHPGMIFNARPISEIYIAEDDFGRINMIFRKFELTSRQAVEKWGTKAKRASEQVDAGKPFEKREYLHWIRPNDDVLHGNIDYTGMPWASMYLDRADGEEIDVGGFAENPYSVARWEVDAGNVYGIGPGQMVLPQAKLLSKMKYTLIKAGEKVTDPALLTLDDQLAAQLRTGPGSINVAEDTGQGIDNIVTQLGNAGRVDIGTDLLQLDRIMAQNAFHNDLLQLTDKRDMTATETRERVSRMQRHLSPIIGRHQDELLHPIVVKKYNGLGRQGILPPPPEIMVRQGIKVEFQSAVQLAQREAEAMAIAEATTYAVNFSGAVPQVLDVVDADDCVRKFYHGKGAPRSNIRPHSETMAIREERARMEAQAAERQRNAEDAEAMTKAAPSLEKLIGIGGQAA